MIGKNNQLTLLVVVCQRNMNIFGLGNVILDHLVAFFFEKGISFCINTCKKKVK